MGRFKEHITHRTNKMGRGEAGIDTMIERYGGSLFGCMDDVGSCCYVCWCTPCAFGSNQTIVGDQCVVCCCAWACATECGLHTCLHASQRDKLEMKLGGQPQGLVGQLCCTTCCCEHCAMCQEARAIQAHSQGQNVMQVRPAQQAPAPVSVSVNVGAPPPPQQPAYGQQPGYGQQPVYTRGGPA